MLAAMRRVPLILLPALACALLAAAVPSPLSPLASGDGRVTISGKVSSDSEVPLSEMVVYLETAGGTGGDSAGAALPNVVVHQKGAKFDPALIIISVGQTVEFHNDEEKPIEHNVFSNAPAKKFDLGLYPPPLAKSVMFDKPGAVFLYCSIHRFMDGVVYVCPTRLHSRVAPDGTYSIAGVTPGTYTLRTWQRRRRFPEKAEPLDLTDGRPRAVNLELRRP
jgi:plastocyanin